MKLDYRTGLVDTASFIPSPNCDPRPEGCVVDAIVIHCISLPPGQFGGPEIQSFFCNCLDHETHPYFSEIRGLRVSAHFLIKRDGSVMQFVSTLERAWHAGQSELEGRSRVNDFSIGIELEGTEDGPFEELQYTALVSLTRVLIEAYPGIQKNRLVGHSDVAPHRKTDPGPHFDWVRFLADL